MPPTTLRATALTAEGFAPFGEVIEVEGRTPVWINDQTCRRYDSLAQVDVAEAGGKPLLSIFEAAPRSMPFRIFALERHPMSSQTFFPLQVRPFLVVVAENGPAPLTADRIRVYLSSGGQGVNYRRGTWHHPLLALEATSRFLVIDRAGSGVNCEEIDIDASVVLVTTD